MRIDYLEFSFPLGVEVVGVDLHEDGRQFHAIRHGARRRGSQLEA